MLLKPAGIPDSDIAILNRILEVANYNSILLLKLKTLY